MFPTTGLDFHLSLKRGTNLSCSTKSSSRQLQIVVWIYESQVTVIYPVPQSSQFSHRLLSTLMEFFKDARVVRLCSHHGKYLIAEKDQISVSQDRNGSADCAKWTVEQIGDNNIRLKSCYGRYLTASTERFPLGSIGKKVIQSLSSDSSVLWIPKRDREMLNLLTNSGKFLRADGGIQPWKNAVTHKQPLRESSLNYMWSVGIVEEGQKPTFESHDGAGTSANTSTPGEQVKPDSGISARDSLIYATAVSGMVGAASSMAGTIAEMANPVE